MWLGLEQVRGGRLAAGFEDYLETPVLQQCGAVRNRGIDLVQTNPSGSQSRKENLCRLPADANGRRKRCMHERIARRGGTLGDGRIRCAESDYIKHDGASKLCA